jgi:hypothetical protein
MKRVKMYFEEAAQPCLAHSVVGCPYCLRDIIERILHHTYSAGNGGYTADIGVNTFSTMIKLTGYDVNSYGKQAGDPENIQD